MYYACRLVLILACFYGLFEAAANGDVDAVLAMLTLLGIVLSLPPDRRPL